MPGVLISNLGEDKRRSFEGALNRVGEWGGGGGGGAYFICPKLWPNMISVRVNNNISCLSTKKS